MTGEQRRAAIAFNLVVQRVRTAGSELVEDQEIYRRVSVVPDSGRSSLTCCSDRAWCAWRVRFPRNARIASPADPVRGGSATHSPIRMGMTARRFTDYDIIGAASGATGLFALQGVDRFNMLCIPPLTRERDLGLSTLLVAARPMPRPPRRCCWSIRRQAGPRRPPRSMHCAAGLPSDSAVMYYPRVQAFDRLRGRLETFASCGAAAA